MNDFYETSLPHSFIAMMYFSLYINFWKHNSLCVDLKWVLSDSVEGLFYFMLSVQHDVA